MAKVLEFFTGKKNAKKGKYPRFQMDVTHTDDEMICSWADGRVKLVCNKKNNHVYKYICGAQVYSWRTLTCQALIREQVKCEYFANKTF